VTAPSVPAGEGDDPRGLSPSPVVSQGRTALPEGNVPRLVLSDSREHKAHVLCYALALEHGRLAGLDPQATARYVTRVRDNAEAFAGADAKLFCGFFTAWFSICRV
jgi:hypothetical protein